MRTLSLALILLTWSSVAALAGMPTGEELLDKTIAYHDPGNAWSTKTIEFQIDVNLAESLARVRGYETRRDGVLIDRLADRFRYRTARGSDRIEVIGDGDEFHALFNASAEISDENRELHRLQPERLPGFRDYFTYVLGIPMKLRDPGTAVDPIVRLGDFSGREVYVLRVTYDADVGDDVWYFYVDPVTYALVGCRFFHDETANDGEYIVFHDEVEAGGLRLPKMRLWYRNIDSDYLASDELISLGVAPSLAPHDGTLPVEERAISAHSKDPYRRFDFWIGEWDVTLRMLREGAWADRVQARASIYPILDGKAILELWDSSPIKGFSLRYFDPAKEKWILWLNWPSVGDSGMSSLEGGFRHGRGEFFSESTNAAGETITNRYSFSDISPDALRWDDAYSKDGTDWRGNWIMEWSRRGAEPTFPPPPGEAPTYADGTRCPDERFRPYETIAGDWKSDDGMAGMTVRKILDGCAVMGFLKVGGDDSFWIGTWDTRAERWEMSVLTDDRLAPLERYTATDDPWDLSAEDGSRQKWEVGDELIWRTRRAGSPAPREIRFRRR